MNYKEEILNLKKGLTLTYVLIIIAIYFLVLSLH